MLTPQDDLDRDPQLAALLLQTNLTGHVSVLLALVGHLRARGRGTLVVLSSIAAVRPSRANFVYGAAKAGLAAFARSLADQLHGTGVRVLLVGVRGVRPGGTMVQGTVVRDPVCGVPGSAVAWRSRCGSSRGR
ncbi:SDR family NAD(P)-dependent oxidoreductase [Streptacidiphilus pinicola]|uniref:SDR family NAD(P)-dependent oxidoreductase n=1 Tax=Streptacidiphilus pinicola TaxID=2219663 RepID=UPI003C732CCF